MELPALPTTRRRAVAASLAVAIAVAAVMVGGTWLLRGGTLLAAASDAPESGDGSGSGVGWQVLPGTFPVSRAWLSGPYLLAPDTQGCLVGFGQINTGTAMTAGYWRAADDCTSAVDITPTHQSVGDVLPSYHRALVVAAVPAPDGGYLAIRRLTFEGDLFAYQSDAIHVDPHHPDGQAQVQQLAEFRAEEDPQASHIGPIALVAAGAGYGAVGRHNEDAVAWTSVDGTSWRQVELPDAGLGSAPRAAALAAGPDGRLVAVGTGGTSAATKLAAGWVSTDGGVSWSQARMPETGGRPSLTTIVHTGHEFVALGREGDPASDGWPTALVLTSPDGVEWTRDDSLAAAGAFSVSTAAVLPDGQLVAASDDYAASDRQDSSRPDQRCATAWVQRAGGWSEEPLGCHGVPTGLAVLPDGSVAGVHWSTLFLRPA